MMNGHLWTGKILKSQSEKAYDNVTPIEQRPNRAFHFYGNSIRRQREGRNVFPLPRDVRESVRAHRTYRQLKGAFNNGR